MKAVPTLATPMAKLLSDQRLPAGGPSVRGAACSARTATILMLAEQAGPRGLRMGAAGLRRAHEAYAQVQSSPDVGAGRVLRCV